MGNGILDQMDVSVQPPQGVCQDELPPPESWEMGDVVDRMKKLLPPSICISSENDECEEEVECYTTERLNTAASSLGGNGDSPIKGIEQVDSFLREALQNSRDRLTILRLEKEVERFMRNPKQQLLEFQPMASSYLRLVAHRVAQHYYLKSMVVDSNTPEGTRIVAQKSSESRFPTVRLADIPVKQPQEETINVAIKPRPHKSLMLNGDSNGLGEFTVTFNPTKSVEERKEEYNKARARIFSTGDLLGEATDEETWIGEGSHNGENIEENWIREESEYASSRGSFTDRVGSTEDEKEQRESALRMTLNANRVAIFRDREKDRKDPDYDRSYERYMQRFDPGFGMSLGSFNMQAIYAPMANYNSEFPQLGGPSRPQVHVGLLHPHSRAQQIQGAWVGSSPVNYRPLDPMMGPFNLGHMGLHSGSGMYLHAPHFTCPRPGTSYIHQQERFQQSLSQVSLVLPPLHNETNFSQARRH